MKLSKEVKKIRDKTGTRYALGQPLERPCPACGEGTKRKHYFDSYCDGFDAGYEIGLTDRDDFASVTANHNHELMLKLDEANEATLQNAITVLALDKENEIMEEALEYYANKMGMGGTARDALKKIHNLRKK